MTDDTHKALTDAVAKLLLHITSPAPSPDYVRAARHDVLQLLARARHEQERPEDRG